MIRTALAPAETAAPSGTVPSTFTFQICTANVSACRKIEMGELTDMGFQFDQLRAGAD